MVRKRSTLTERPIESYRHADKERLNRLRAGPPSGCGGVGEERSPGLRGAVHLSRRGTQVPPGFSHPAGQRGDAGAGDQCAFCS